MIYERKAPAVNIKGVMPVAKREDKVRQFRRECWIENVEGREKVTYRIPDPDDLVAGPFNDPYDANEWLETRKLNQLSLYVCGCVAVGLVITGALVYLGGF